MQQLKRQVSCVRFDLNNLAESTGSMELPNDDVFTNNDTLNGNGDIDLPPPSPFLDKNGQPIKRKSKSNLWIKTNKKQEASDVLNHLSFSASSRKLMRLILKRAESIWYYLLLAYTLIDLNNYLFISTNKYRILLSFINQKKDDKNILVLWI